MTEESPEGAGVELFMRVGDGEELLVGVARNVESVPGLLSAIAEQWSGTAGRLVKDPEWGWQGSAPWTP